MDIGDNVSNSIGYAKSELSKMLILGVILIIPIINFIGSGYSLRIIKSTLAGLDELPEFDDIGELFIDGLKVLVVGIVYAIPLILISLILGAGQEVAISDNILSGAAFWGLIVGYIIYIIVAIIIGFVEVIAIANLAYYDGEIGAAFRFSEIMKHISRIGWADYIIWYIVIVLIAIIIGILAVIISVILAITIIGIILIPVLFILVAGFLTIYYSRSLALLFASGIE